MHTVGASNKRLKLAFIPYFCYPDGSFKSGNTQEIETLLHSNISHRADGKGSNRGYSRLSTPFALATGVLFSATMMLSSPAFAKDSANNLTPTAPVAMNTTTVPAPVPTNVSFDAVELLPDAHGPAAAWVVGHSDRLAIPVRLGLDTKVPPEVLERVLRADFAAHGITIVKFFFEVGEMPATTLAYVSDDYVSPTAYPLSTARKHVEETAKQFKFNIELTAGL